MTIKNNGVIYFGMILLVSLGGTGPACAASTPTVTPTSVPSTTASPGPVETPIASVTPTPTPTSPTVDVSVDSPTQVIQKYTKELISIVEPDKKEKGKRDTGKEQQIAEKVRQFFDFQGLARMSLGRHWLKVTQAQRDEYSRLFLDLVEDSYLKRSRDLVGSYDLSYQAEEVKGNRAKVTCRVARNDADVTIIYELHRNPKNWMIFNISLDNVDLVRNYQSQFNSIIGKYGFDELLKRMRKKAEAAEEEVDL